MNFRFPKEERLCGKKETACLLKSGSRIYSGELVLIFHKPVSTSSKGVRVLLLVPKKNFPLANQRNKIKRCLREVWRHSRNEYFADVLHHHHSLHLAFLVKHKTLPSLETLKNEMLQALHLLKQKSTQQSKH